jgi:hypothetical protein
LAIFLTVYAIQFNTVRKGSFYNTLFLPCSQNKHSTLEHNFCPNKRISLTVIEAAKARGQKSGAPSKLTQEQILAIKEKANSVGADKSTIAREFEISRPTLYIKLLPYKKIKSLIVRFT